MGKSVDPEKLLNKAGKFLNYDLDFVRHSRRISRSIKDDRDLLVYLAWKTRMLTNEKKDVCLA